MDIKFLVSALQMAGDIAKSSFEQEKYKNVDISHPEVKEKSFKELVIEEDMLCEKIIISEIERNGPKGTIYSEEMNNIDDLVKDTSELKYLVDPLDGTHNFFFGLPLWGLAAAILNKNNVPISGVIFLPMMDLLLKCEGPNQQTEAWIDKKWLPVRTHQKPLDKSLICYDNQFYKMGDRAVNIYESLVRKSFTTRITGSAVCDCAFIACGKINSRLWNNTNSYDIAAGISIVKGAGGSVCDFSGNSINALAKEVVICSDESLKDQILELIRLT